MNDETTYTIQELADRTGLSPRTIHFYISQGLLRGVGRQGPSSRYPESHLHTLLFIRELQTQARLSLEEIARVLPRIPPETLAAIARGEERLSVADLRSTGIPIDAHYARRSSLSLGLGPATLGGIVSRGDESAPEAMAELPRPTAPESARSRAGRFLRRHRGESEPPSPEPRVEATPDPRETALRESLAMISRLAEPEIPEGRIGQSTWVTIHVSDDLTISARGMSPEELGILERIGQTIRQMLNRARRTADEKEPK